MEGVELRWSVLVWCVMCGVSVLFSWYICGVYGVSGVCGVCGMSGVSGVYA